MTKRLFAGLFIVQGILGIVVSIAWGYHASEYAYRLAIPSTLMSCAEIWIGAGLLRNSPLARWLALGAGSAMIIGGVVVPILTLVAAGSLELVLAGFGFSHPPSWVNTARWLALLLVFYAIISAIISFKGFRYLRSHEGRLEFGGSEEAPGVLRDESFGVVVASTITWLLASWLSMKEVTIMASSVPRFLMSAEMKRAAEAKDAKDVESITAGAMFTLDSKHVVFPPSALSPEVKVLDIESGKLRRTKLRFVPAGRDFNESIAPDASSLVTSNKWYSLVNDESRLVKSLAYEHLGFHSPTKMLQYDSKTQRLELVDIERDEKLFSLPISLAQRGEPSSGKPYNWSEFSQRWSDDRRRYAWMNRDNSLSVLDVDSGDVRNVSCRYCAYGGAFSFTYSGDQIFVPDAVSRGDDSPQGQLGGLLDIATEQWTPVSYRGDLENVAPDGSAAGLVRHNANAFDYQSLGARTQVWTLKMSDEFAPVRTSGNGRFLYTFRKGENAGATLMYAAFDPPEDRARVDFLTIESSLEGGRWSPDWTHLLRASGPKIELISLDPATGGHNAIRTMDVLEDSQLSAAQDAQSNAGVTASWEEDRSRGEENLQADTTLPAQSGEPLQEVAQPVEVPQAEVPPAPAAGGIVKCVDTSGSVTFTQGFCPAGMRRADAPVIDSAPSQPYVSRAASRGTDGGTAQGGAATLNSIMRPGDKMEGLKMHREACPGRPQLMATYFEGTIRRASGGADVVFAAGAGGRQIFPNAGSALEGACALL